MAKTTIYTYSAAADYLGVRYATIMNWVESGKLDVATNVEGANCVTVASVEKMKRKRDTKVRGKTEA